MKYGVLSAEDFNPEVEGYPDYAVCVVGLEDDGEAVVIDQLVLKETGMLVGLGYVYDIETGGSFYRYISLPTDVTTLGAYDTTQDALDAAMGVHYNVAVRIEARINDRMLSNAVERRELSVERWMRRIYNALIVLIAILVIIAAWYIVTSLRGR